MEVQIGCVGGHAPKTLSIMPPSQCDISPYTSSTL
jgi:hypothetical protein